MSKWSGLPRMTRRIVWLIRPLLMVLTKRDWQGADRLPAGGYVLAPNHLSHVDPILISHFMVDHGITPRFLAKDTILSGRVLGRILRATEQIPVYRSTEGAAESLKAAIAAVESGQVITIYPEGTITRDSAAWPMSGRTGAVRVALATGRPLIPMVQWGPQEILWPYSNKFRVFPRKTIHIRIGEPLDLTEFAGQPITETILRAATERLMDTLTDMLSDLRGELPSGPRIDVHSLEQPKTNYKRLES